MAKPSFQNDSSQRKYFLKCLEVVSDELEVVRIIMENVFDFSNRLEHVSK